MRRLKWRRHPAWCDRRECYRGRSGVRTHASSAIEVGEGLVVQLTQYADGAPLVEVMCWYPPDPGQALDPTTPDEVLILTFERASELARAVGYLMYRAGRDAAGGVQ